MSRKVLRTFHRVIGNPKIIFKKLGIKVLSRNGHYKYRRFIVLTRGRTGSNMLAKAYSMQPRYIYAKGFKIFYFHPKDNDPNNIRSDLGKFDDLLVIHLKRRNILRTLISR